MKNAKPAKFITVDVAKLTIGVSCQACGAIIEVANFYEGGKFRPAQYRCTKCGEYFIVDFTDSSGDQHVHTS